MAPAPDGELMAVLLALAGPRPGDPVCVQAPGHRMADRWRRGLLAMSSTESEAATGARVCVAGGAKDLPEAVRRTIPGGKIICLSKTRRRVAQDLAPYPLVLLHVEAIGACDVVWAARLTEGTPPAS